MLLKTMRFISLVLTALTLAPTYAHVLELPGKLTLSGADWLTVQHHLYGAFGVFGGTIEPLALLATLAVLVLVRGHRLTVALTLLAAACLAGMLLDFAIGNNPINGRVAAWTPATLPATWRQARDAWEAWHAASAAFATVALIALTAALVRDTAPPYGEKRQRAGALGDPT